MSDGRLNGRINPNHPVVQAVESQWYKLCAILLRRLGGETRIAVEEIQDFASAPCHNIVVDTRGDGDSLLLKLVSDQRALELARQEGGLPQ